MEPAAEFLTPPSLISVSSTTEICALHGVVSRRQARVHGCGEVLASPKTLRAGRTGIRLFTYNRGGHHGRDSQNHRSDVLWCRVVSWSVNSNGFGDRCHDRWSRW
jgi:hypothetical protein